MCWHHFGHYGILTYDCLQFNHVHLCLEAQLPIWGACAPIGCFQCHNISSSHCPNFQNNMFLWRDHNLHQKNLSFIIIILFNVSIPISSHCPNFQHNVVTSIFVTSKKMLSFIIIFNIPFPVKCLKQPLSQFSTHNMFFSRDHTLLQKNCYS